MPKLKVSELLAHEGELRPSERALSLAGQHVRLVGFMAELEEPLEGALFLTAAPVHCDESGAGTADLPPDAVLVHGGPLATHRSAHVAGLIEAVGVLAVGNRSDAAGRVSNFQLELDDLGPQSTSQVTKNP